MIFHIYVVLILSFEDSRHMLSCYD